MSAGLYSETRGSGPDLVLWHGWGMNLRVFDSLVDELATHFRVTTVDLPGHGRSPAPRGDELELLLPSLQAALPARCALVGWSLGGMLALQMARQAPEQVRALVLLHSTPKFVASEDWPHGVGAAVLGKFAQSLADSPERTVTDFIDLQVRGSRDAAAVTHQLRGSLRQQGHAHPTALVAGLKLLRDTDLRETAARIHRPTLLVAGQYDRVTPPAASHALAALMPDAHVEELPRAGHASFLSHTPILASLCTDWLQARMTAPVLA